MLENYILKYKDLPINSKREFLLKEVKELLNDLLKSSSLIKNKDVLFEEDYYDLLFIYIIYIKEDLAQVL